MHPLFTCLLLAAGAECFGKIAFHAIFDSVIIAILAWNLMLGVVCAALHTAGYDTYPNMLLGVVGYAAAAILVWATIVAVAGGCYWAHMVGARLRGVAPFTETFDGPYWYICGFLGSVSLLFVAVAPWWAVTSNPMDMPPKQIILAAIILSAIVVVFVLRMALRSVCRQVEAARTAAVEMYVAAENMEAADAAGTRSYSSV